MALITNNLTTTTTRMVTPTAAASIGPFGLCSCVAMAILTDDHSELLSILVPATEVLLGTLVVPCSVA